MHPSRRRLLLAAVAGLVVGLGLAALVVSRWPPESDVVTGEEAARAFVEAWERSKRATFSMVSESRRVTADGRELVSTVELVQRPPDFLRQQYGSVDGRLDEQPIVCSTDPNDQVRCTVGTGQRTYDDLVAEEVAAWDSYFFEPAQPVYRVETTGDGCFDLHLTIVFPAPPYGERARFCFDETTGALSYTEVHKKEATDVVEAIEIRTEVTDADFELPA